MSGLVFSPSLLSTPVSALILPSTQGKLCKTRNLEIKRTSVWILINIRKLKPPTPNLVWALSVTVNSKFVKGLLVMVLSSLEKNPQGEIILPNYSTIG